MILDIVNPFLIILSDVVMSDFGYTFFAFLMAYVVVLFLGRVSRR